MSGPVSTATSDGRLKRLFDGRTAIDFVGQRKRGFIASGLLILLTIVSLSAQGLNLGIDFVGGVSWDVPADNGFTVDDAEDVLAENGLSTEGARLQDRSSETGHFVKVQVGDQPPEVGLELRADFAAAAGVAADDIDVNVVSASWGAEVSNAAARALVIFVIVVAIYLSIRLEWRMALAAIIAMLHDIVIAVGIYSILQFIVTPPTVIAFLTILGYSLYDTVVVFDRVKENEARFAAHKPPYDDIINVSLNQMLARSLNTSFSSLLPVISLLVIGAGLFGQTTLAEFAIALFIGMAVGAYSSILIAAPLLGMLKKSDGSWEERNIPRAVGEPLREMVMGGSIGSRRERALAAEEPVEPERREPEPALASEEPASTRPPAGGPSGLTHPPRPRKKKRRR